MARALLNDARMPWGYWEEALGHATNLHNCTIPNVLTNVTPHKSLLGTALDNSKLRMIGCAAYVHVNKAARRSKLAKITLVGIYLGTLNGLYRIQLFQTDRVVHFEHATFDKYRFPAESEVIEKFTEEDAQNDDGSCAAPKTECVIQTQEINEPEREDVITVPLYQTKI